MNTFIIQKCLDELNTKEPNISYIKGILETLVVMSGGSVPSQVAVKEIHNPKVNEEVDEVLMKYEKGTTGKLTQS